jgi:hypothetical protein
MNAHPWAGLPPSKKELDGDAASIGPVISARDFSPLGVEVGIYAHLERDSVGSILAKLTVRGRKRIR